MPQNQHAEEVRKELDRRLKSDIKFRGETHFDQTTRVLYSTDASIYQIEPLGVVFPQSTDDIAGFMTLAHEMEIPVLPRGSGSSLAGQAIGAGVIIDCTRHLNRILNIDPESRTASVEPGVILAGLNRQAAMFGLQFGPDPASAERATLGGSIANNAAGAHSIIYGLTADHLLTADVVLSDGSTASFKPQSIQSAQMLSSGHDVLARIYQSALRIRENYAADIQAVWPKTWRRVSGYNLNYLLPWSPSIPPLWETANLDWLPQGSISLPYPPVLPGEINLAALLAGSEGTLAIIQRAVLRLVPRPQNTILGLLAYPSIADACDAVPEILGRNPSAIELIPFSLVHLAQQIPAYANLLSFVSHLDQNPSDKGALLVIEFSGQELREIRQKALALGPKVWLAESAESQKNVWSVRKVGLGILMSRLGSNKPVAFIEDIAIPVERLGEFIRYVDQILAQAGTTAEIYAHASAGCLHIRPILNLKTLKGTTDLRAIASQVVSLAMNLGGAISGEHGDGLARSEWIAAAYGQRVLTAFQDLKFAADPKGLLNPGKIINPSPMDSNLRYGSDYQASAWTPQFHYSLETTSETDSSGLLAAIEHCNGAGVCRKADGVMCPSFQASQDEMHSTRGRANLLRWMVSAPMTEMQRANLAQQSVREALDLCLACKGCKAECPSGVDMAKLKYEFMYHYYAGLGHRRPLRDYLFGYIDRLARLGQPFAGIANPILASNFGRKVMELFFGLSSQRTLPALASQTLNQQLRRLKNSVTPVEQVLFLSDAFTEYFHPSAGLAAIQLLQEVGCKTMILPSLGAGRTLISKGFLQAARQHAKRLLMQIRQIDPDGIIPVVGVEPSEIYTLCDEYPDLFFEDPYVHDLSERAWMVDEFLLRPGTEGKSRLERIKPTESTESLTPVFLHGHCYQKARPPAQDSLPVGVAASAELLRYSGYSVRIIDDGCCGMAGAFGYEKEHAEFSFKVAELALLPAIRSLPVGAQIAAAGVSCQAQIEDGSGWQVFHPVELASLRLLNH